MKRRQGGLVRGASGCLLTCLDVFQPAEIIESQHLNSAFHAVNGGSNPPGDATFRYKEEYQSPKDLGILYFFVLYGFLKPSLGRLHPNILWVYLQVEMWYDISDTHTDNHLK